MRDYAVLRSHRLITINGEHEHLANAITIAKAESRAHPKAEISVVHLVTSYRYGREIVAMRRTYHHAHYKKGTTE